MLLKEANSMTKASLLLAMLPPFRVVCMRFIILMPWKADLTISLLTSLARK